MHKALPLRDDIDSIGQKKNEDKDLPALKLPWIHQED